MDANTDNILSSEKVRYSRAGDAFHYRWAARRCLEMLNPLSPIKTIVVEGSKERKLAGEYIIDIAEYYISDDKKDLVRYYQLKHTTVYKDVPFNLSHLKDTIVGFAERYKEHISRKENEVADYYIVTNRKISSTFKVGIEKIKSSEECNKQFFNTFKKYTALGGDDLRNFCRHLKFMDGLGDFQEQWYDLYFDTAKLLAGDIGHPQIDTITTLVAEKALPNSDGVIRAEDILKRFGCKSKRDLYPAPNEIEKVSNPIIRGKYLEITEEIINSKEPVIVHAAGGVGKSVFVILLKDLLPKESVVITYDCFGLGKYRNRTQTRHRYRDGIVQIANELAGKGLCDPLIALSTALDDDILRMFLQRLQLSIQNIRSSIENGKLYLIIDAADNAEMAAREFGDNCFIHELLREELPEHCHLVMLCRTERIDLLEPSSLVNKIELMPFDKDETFKCLKEHFKDVTKENALEFHRLTNGNPRVQANALAFGNGEIKNVLENLGPIGSTVDKQIEYQLERAIEKIRNRLTKDYQKQVEAICCGLASLPPFIPISVLAVAADVEELTVRSFISELGRPIWVADFVVQFRDEPTETWFRKRFLGTVDQVRDYIGRLKPMASQFTYVAEVLPILYLQAEYNEELVELALSEDCLPEDNPIDRRNVQIFRLRFAFKAALRLKKYYDASKLAMLAGEEMAGNERQLEIFKENTDLIAPLQDSQKVQELAFKRVISSAWEGSENVYAASLLSSIPEYHGESRAYLRAAEHWLRIYFEEREKDKEERYIQEKLQVEEIVEFVFCHYNLNGTEQAVKFMTSWSPKSLIFQIASIFTRKLIDFGKFDHIAEMAKLSNNNVYVILGINNELLKVGHFIDKAILENCLAELDMDKLEMPHLKDYSYKGNSLEALLSFAEICVAYYLDSDNIRMMLEKFIPVRAPFSFGSDYRNSVRTVFLRTVALRRYLNLYDNKKEEEWLPEKYVVDKRSYKDDQEIKELKEVYDTLIPWYDARLSALMGNYELNDILDEANKKSKGSFGSSFRRYDPIPYEISQLWIEIMLLSRKCLLEDIKKFYVEKIQSCEKLGMDSKIQALRAANRKNDLSIIRDDLEELVFKSIKESQDETETKAKCYVELARATMYISKADASEYFNMAIMEVSRFGDELPSRWKAVAETAKRCTEQYNKEDELAYRFIRCAELVGENVAREKYWDRAEAIKICTKLSPASGLASISRWRERSIGWFEELFSILATTISETNYLKPEAIWSLSAFIKDSSMLDLATKCIKNSNSKIVKNNILESLIKYFRILEMPIFAWDKLKKFVDEEDLAKEKVTSICKVMKENQSTNGKEIISQSSHSNHKLTEDEKKLIFEGLDLMLDSDILKAISRFKDIQDYHSNKQEFWQTLYIYIPHGSIVEFMEKFVELPFIDFYELQEALHYIPETWMKKPSFIRKWPLILKGVATMHASKLISWYTRREFLSISNFNDDQVKIIREGIVEGLAQKESIDTADEYFNFVVHIQDMITPPQAKSLLEFSLSRFEINIDDDFGDGEWAEWLVPDNVPEMNLARFIWTSLGSPEAGTRWNAVHAIKRLAEFGCVNEIKSLMQCRKKSTAGCFGSIKFPFYYLNAHLYLLIALQRISVENAEILLQYVNELSEYMYWDIPHALIQIMALNIIRNIEKAFPGSYNEEAYNQLILKGESQFPLIMANCSYKVADAFYVDNAFEEKVEFRHGYDFDRYWFEPLGKIFGVSGKVIEKLATKAIIDEWKVPYDGTSLKDPRQALWNSYKYEKKIWHSHEQHPSVERYNFYLSYHAMFVVAASLFDSMPIVFRKDWDEKNPWDTWIERHSLCRQDGFLLADCRGNVPIEEPSWVNIEKDKNWRTNISDLYFLENLIMRDGKICVKGYWENGQGNYREDISIASALVSKETSQSLISALITCNDSRDYKLPDYGEEGMEQDENPFIMLGWIKHDNANDGLDKFDPWSGDISYPNYEVGDTYQELLKLQINQLRNKWYKVKVEDAQIVCENWSRLLVEHGDEEFIKGKRMVASLDVLKELCEKTGFNLVLEVQINRYIKRSGYSSDIEDNEYIPPIHKVYLLSERGVLSNERGNIEFRKDVS